MPIEACVLVGMALLTAAMILAHVVSALVEGRFHWALGARDENSQPGKFGGRAERALRNQLEASALYLPLAVALLTSHANTLTTAKGAALFFTARVVYAPLYWLGVPYLRTMVFGAGLFGLAMMAAPAIEAALVGLGY